MVSLEAGKVAMVSLKPSKVAMVVMQGVLVDIVLTVANILVTT